MPSSMRPLLMISSTAACSATLIGLLKLKGKQPHAVRDADILGALTDRAIKDLGRGTMRVFLEEVMLDLPHVIDPEPIGEFDLR